MHQNWGDESVQRVLTHSGSRLWGHIIGNRDRIDFDQVTGGQRRHSQQRVDRLVVPEQRHPGLLDYWQVLITPVVGDVDRDLCHLIWPGTGGRESPAKVSEYLAGLKREITRPNKISFSIFGFLARNEHESTSSRDHDLSVRERNGEVVRIDTFERH